MVTKKPDKKKSRSALGSRAALGQESRDHQNVGDQSSKIGAQSDAGEEEKD